MIRGIDASPQPGQRAVSRLTALSAAGLRLAVGSGPPGLMALGVQHATQSHQKTPGYCWSTPFKVLEVLCLGEVCSAFLPSKKAYWAHQFQYLGVDQQYPPVYGHQRIACTVMPRLVKPTVSLGVTSAVVSNYGHDSGQIEQ